VTGKSVTRGTSLKFLVQTNMYPAVDSSMRSPLNPETDGYIDIKVKDPNDAEYTTLLNDSIGTLTAGPNSILTNYVDSIDWNWGHDNYYWQTGALDLSNYPIYPAGTYTVWAESTLHGMKDNYKNGGADYTGRTVSEPKTVTIVNAAIPPVFSQEEAVTYVVDNVLPSPPGPDTALQVSDAYIPANTPVTLWDGTTITSPPGYSSWLVFIDEDKNANWDHGCNYTFVNDEGVNSDLIPATSPPKDVELTYSTEGHIPNPVGLFSTEPPFNLDPACAPDSSHNWAILISGGIDKTQNPIRYSNDISFMYKTLVKDYKYDKSHIIVLLSDGSANTAADQIVSYTGTTPNYGDTNADLDGDGTKEVYNAATKTNILNALKTAPLSTLASTESLTIFTTNHGGWDKVANANPNNNNVNLYTWGGETITDKEFVAALPKNAKSITMIMEQCYGGGFVDDFITNYATVSQGGTVATRVITTAANGNQVSHSNDFSYYWISGMAGHDSVLNPVNADVSPVDSRVSMLEGYTYSSTNNPSAKAGIETPQRAGPDSAQFLSSCASTQPAISVTMPATTPANTWTKAGKYTVKWSTTALPTSPVPYVKVQLMKGVYPGVWQADLTPSKLASTGSTGVAYIVPAALPGGAGTDYWIKISTIALSPTVIGKSSNFAITGVTKSATGTLTINALPSAISTGSPIDITDSMGSTVYIGSVPQTGMKTPKVFSGLAAGAYLVKVSATCYYPMNPSAVTLLAGASQTKTYTLVPMPAGCTNSEYPYGSIAVTSVPEEGFEVYLDDTDMGYGTPVIQNIGPGEHNVRLEMPGYDTQSETVTVETGKTVNADFTLNPQSTGPILGEISVPVDPVTIGTEIEISSSLKYLGDGEPLTAVWTWDDGTTTTENDVPAGSVTGTHTYTKAGDYTISLVVTDKDGMSASTTAQLHVTVTEGNVAPLVDAGPDAAISTGGTFTGTGSFTDPDDGDIWTATVDYGDGSGSQTLSLNPDKTFSLNHIYTVSGQYTVTVTVNDDKGGTGSDSATIMVNDFAISGDYLTDEGAAYVLSLISNGPVATTIIGWNITWGDGPVQEVAGNPGSVTHTYADGPNIYGISATATDGVWIYQTEGTVDVTVNNVAPTVDAGQDTVIDEGSSFSQSGSFTDAGTGPWTATVDYGDGSGLWLLLLNADKTFALSHTYPDNGLYTINVTVKETKGGAGSDTATITVNNVAPEVDAGSDAVINKGSIFVRMGSFTDPGTDTWTATVDYGDGSGIQQLALEADRTFSLSHSYSITGIFTVNVTVTDKDGKAGSDTVAVKVNEADANSAPVVNTGQDTTITQGSTFSRSGSFTDPDSKTWTATVDYGDGSGIRTLRLNRDKTFSLSHGYANIGVYTVVVNVTDDKGGVGTDSVLVTVTTSNAAPVVNAGLDTTITKDSTFSRTGSFTDTDSNSWTANVSYGDGSGIQPLALNADKTFSLSHGYANIGVYTVVVNVTDDKGGVGTDSVLVTVTEANVVVQVQIVPQPLNIGKNGYFLAFVKLPAGYKAADVDAGSVYCENKQALRLIRINMFPQIFAAIFSRQDLAVSTGNIKMTVRGTITKNGATVPFSGVTSVNVINKKVTTKEDVDSVLNLSDSQIFNKFNKY
jgi:PKD repeat protein